MELPEKKAIEKRTAEVFLGLYNDQMKTSFEFIELSEHPDVICQDITSGNKLELEISLLPDIPGQIPYLLGRANPPVSPTLKTIAYQFADIIATYKPIISKKLLASYGQNTALVFYCVSGLLEPKEWVDIQFILKESFIGKEENFGAGIWVICSDARYFPAKDTLFCLSNPQE
jgi:hypothetical protein